MRKPSLQTVIGIALLLLVVLGFIFILYYFGMISLFYLLGIEYRSLWSLAWFVILFLVSGLIIEMITKSLIYTVVPKVKRYSLQKVCEITIQFVFIFPLIHFLERLFTSITIPVVTQAALAFLIVTIETLIENKDYTKRNKPI
ncbi:regulatory YrvL family protein [Alkalihalobacillus sp. LMS6]|uniref:YrvL family regulatory protein n=1 Tax=Bacillaceae TaxID=186817 RepID=UPI000C08440D|nr:MULTISPECIES: YrvL family regulatory protein [Bacillaceae]UTR07746.1 regulatory YrvL family protein [Alkalihalobacillus sp. LMS6]